MVTVRKSELLTPTSVIPENTYYYEFDCDTIAELPTATYQGTNVAHGSLATIIANGRQYRINGEGEWCIQRYDASDPILIEKTITENGTYSGVDDDADGYSSVIANVPNTYTESDEGKVVDNGELVAQTARAETIVADGTYDTTKNNSVTVDVPGVQFSNSPAILTLAKNIILSDVVIPNGVMQIGTQAFQYSTLESVYIPSTVTTINNYAFSSCKNLRNVTIENGLTRLRERSFAECTALTSIELPNSVNDIDSATFIGCTNLTSIVINKAENSILGAPWGAPNATVVWTG